MKNFKQHLLKSTLALLMAGVSFGAFAQQQDTEPIVKPTISADVDPPGGGQKPPPPVLNSDEKINDHSELELEIFPNPNNGDFNVKLSDKTEIETIIITDIVGNIVHKQNVKELPSAEVKIQLNNVNAGIYLLNTGKSVHKFKVL